MGENLGGEKKKKRKKKREANRKGHNFFALTFFSHSYVPTSNRLYALVDLQLVLLILVSSFPLFK